MNINDQLIKTVATILLLSSGWSPANAEPVKGEEAPGKPVVIDVSNYRIGATWHRIRRNGDTPTYHVPNGMMCTPTVRR